MNLFPGEVLRLFSATDKKSAPRTIRIVEHERGSSYTVVFETKNGDVKYPYVQLTEAGGETFLMAQGNKDKGFYEIAGPIHPRRQVARDLVLAQRSLQVLSDYALTTTPPSEDYVRRHLQDLRVSVESLDKVIPGLLPLPKDKP
jgi:hypothetical protein